MISCFCGLDFKLVCCGNSFQNLNPSFFFQRIIIFVRSVMGNSICGCGFGQIDDLQDHYKLKKKSTLEAPEVKQNYQRKISMVLNHVLDKFKENKRVKKIILKGEIGKGGQGEVMLVQVIFQDAFDDQYEKQYAMKRVSKTRLSVERVRKALLLENQLLSTHCSPFLVDIQYAFQDNAYLYYLMDVAKGGDAFGYIYTHSVSKKSKAKQMEDLGQNGIKFLIAGVILGLEYLNDQQIIYRDLKPQNILMFEDGYPKLADFGIVKKYKQNQLYYDQKGTVIYFSPEMAMKKGYSKAHDLWSLGVLIYEMLFRTLPFDIDIIESNRFEQWLQLHWISNPKFPSKKASPQIISLITSLLKINPEERIGYRSYDEIKSHEFFEGFDWQKYMSKELESPFVSIIQNHPIQFPATLKQEVDEFVPGSIQFDIPFTFVREEPTQASTFQKIQGRSSDESLQ